MPSITGSWTSLSQTDFEATHPNGGFLHFRPRGFTELDPFTKVDTGKSARELIQDLVDVNGWPLIGIFISGSGQSTPHLVIHRSAFPAQTGNPGIRKEKLQNDLDAAMQNIFKTSLEITDLTDEDFGQVVDIQNFWVNTRVFTYRQDWLYVPGDYVFRVGNSQPSGQWWAA